MLTELSPTSRDINMNGISGPERREFGLPEHALDSNMLETVAYKALIGLTYAVSIGFTFADRASQLHRRSVLLKSRIVEKAVEGLSDTIGIMVYMDKQSLRDGTAIEKARRY